MPSHSLPLRTLILIPTYRELTNLIELLPILFAAQPEAHVLLLNDESGDGTPDWVRQQPDYGIRLFLFERSAKLGLGTAYRSGFRWALERDYEVIFEMDADLSHDPASIEPMRRQIEAGADLVVGSRYLRGVRVLNWPIERLLLSLGAGQYVKLLTGLPGTDPTSGFKCFHRKVLEQIELHAVHSSGYAFQIEMNFLAWRRQFRLEETPIIFTDRHNGLSKMSHRIALEAIWEVARMGWQRWFSPRPKKGISRG